MKDHRGFAGIGIVVGAGVFLLAVLVLGKLDDHRRRQNLRPDPSLFTYVVQHNDPKLLGSSARLLKMTLKDRADPNTLNDNGNTPLHVALSQREPCFRIIRILLIFGADPDFSAPNGDTPLHLAARRGSGSVMTALIKAGGDPFIVTKDQTESPYALAARLGNAGAVGAIKRSKAFKKFKKDQKK